MSPPGPETECTDMTEFSTIEEAIKEIAAGRAVIVVDDESRENEGDLIFAAQLATTELLAFMVRYTSGFICAPLTEADADRLELPPVPHPPGPARDPPYGDAGRAGGRQNPHLARRPRPHPPAAVPRAPAGGGARPPTPP